MPLRDMIRQRMVTFCIPLACGSFDPSWMAYLDHCGLLCVSVLHIIGATCCCR